ncbi:MAG TPA: hypothetical protein VFS39_16255 [Nitrospira sp.]|nr:hypothetical protein [Nitrospira sp.]
MGVHRRFFSWLIVLCLPSFAIEAARAETPAPSVHWGSIAYPDQFRSLRFGGTFDRFTEFDGAGTRYHSTINESFGLNLATASWTEHWAKWPGWSTNLTLGIGPTGSQPTEYIQNNLVHPVLGDAPIRVGRKREDVTDGMVDASLTRWLRLLNDRPELFLGGGISVGTIYQEEFARIGVRRSSFDSFIPVIKDTPLHYVTDYLRFSGMARYSRLQSGALVHDVKPYSFLYQVSVSLGPYGTSDDPPHWEIEFALTWDSGIFTDATGQSRKEFFWSAAATYAAFRFETWNDSLHHKDKGPTYGFTVTIDLFKL